ncbi:carboxymuconolactone decarboxylase family protein [Marivita geojedonensis]|uniref:Carboxymuconolactone decarboxylase n=1 Tax=Marivita geojedonensis TaxID=1123756 RepID=A0A1X4NI30_9RHOB|nr:carboxymuconolactone decarboxylase family protein [Marivita geojedonensis]OSQ47829.1 carboxymuconolactone decarboxylase [Marivita geojedonensis]PRY74744.1 alkylhydroperoxidase family enzyme [Marivita geojedonensis]
MTDFDFTPMTDAAWPVEVTDLRDGFAGALNVYRVMAHHPALLRAWAPLREHIVNQTTLGPQLSEVAILRTGHRLGSSYEWQQHIDRARRRGLSDARIASIAGPCEDMALQDALIARAVDELMTDHRLSQASIDGIARDLGKLAVLDLIATVGFYSVLGYELNSFDVPLDDDIAEVLRQTPLNPGGH